MPYYENSAIYLDSATTLRDKISKMNQIISGLENLSITAAATGNFSEYSVDNGQSKIRTVYRSLSEIANAITAYEKIRQRYINKLNGSNVRLIDGKNFPQNFTR